MTTLMSTSPAQLADRALHSLMLTSVYARYSSSGVQFDALRSRIAELVAHVDNRPAEATVLEASERSLLHEQAIAELENLGAITENDARRLVSAARFAVDQCRIS